MMPFRLLMISLLNASMTKLCKLAKLLSVHCYYDRRNPIYACYYLVAMVFNGFDGLLISVSASDASMFVIPVVAMSPRETIPTSF